jgi:hypothetical protein
LIRFDFEMLNTSHRLLTPFNVPPTPVGTTSPNDSQLNLIPSPTAKRLVGSQKL